MSQTADFADVLQQFVNRSSYSAGQLATLGNGMAGIKTAISTPPFQAIPALPYFVGRQALIKQIEEILLPAQPFQQQFQ